MESHGDELVTGTVGPDHLAETRGRQVGALDGRIQNMQRALEGIDADAEPEAYSATFQELIALQRQRRDLWSHD